MKHLLRPVAAAIVAWVAAGWAVAAEPARYAAMTFNIRYGTARDGDNHWEKRRHVVAHVINRRKPDLAGLQEALHFQIEYLLEQCPDYAYVGAGRDDGKTRGEQNPVLYRRDRFDLISSNTLWLSDTPEKFASKTWGNDFPRIVTYAVLKDKKAGREIVFASTHFSHMSENHRRRSAEFLKKRLPAITENRPTLLVGDFNAKTGSAAYESLVGDPSTTADGTYIDTFVAASEKQKSQPGTFGGFTGKPRRNARIDWVLCSEHFAALSCEILHDNLDGRYPSDHYPVLAIVQLK